MGDASFEVVGEVAIFRLAGNHRREEGVRLIAEAILRVKASGLDKLLVDITGITDGTGAIPPSAAERHWAMREWAAAGSGAVRFAIVIRPEFADPDNLGTIVAVNHGFAARGFRSVDQALDWLMDRPPKP